MENELSGMMVGLLFLVGGFFAFPSLVLFGTSFYHLRLELSLILELAKTSFIQFLFLYPSHNLPSHCERMAASPSS